MGVCSQRTSRLKIPGLEDGPDTFVPFGMIEGYLPGPRVAIVAGVHGTELTTQDAALELWNQLQAEQIHGSVTVIFVADVMAAQSGIPAANPVDGKNLNRVWPGSQRGSFSERLAAEIWQQLLVLCEVVIDLHGGEWTEEVAPFGIVHPTGDPGRDQSQLELAIKMGLPYLQTTEGLGTLSGAAVRAGKSGLALEIGGGGRRDPNDVQMVVCAVRRVLDAIGLAAFNGEGGQMTKVLDFGVQLRSSAAGVVAVAVQVGQWVEKGQVLCTVNDFGGQLLEKVAAPHAGWVLLRALSRVVREGALLATVGWVDQ